MFANTWLKERVVHTQPLQKSSLAKQFYATWMLKGGRQARRVGYAAAFLVTVVLATDWLTSEQLRASPYYRYSYRLITEDPRVQSLLGDDIGVPYTVSCKKYRKHYTLHYRLSGSAQSANISVSGTIDPHRDFINNQSFQSISVHKTQSLPFFWMNDSQSPPIELLSHNPPSL